MILKNKRRSRRLNSCCRKIASLIYEFEIQDGERHPGLLWSMANADEGSQEARLRKELHVSGWLHHCLFHVSTFHLTLHHLRSEILESLDLQLFATSFWRLHDRATSRFLFASRFVRIMHPECTDNGSIIKECYSTAVMLQFCFSECEWAEFLAFNILNLDQTACQLTKVLGDIHSCHWQLKFALQPCFVQSSTTNLWFPEAKLPRCLADFGWRSFLICMSLVSFDASRAIDKHLSVPRKHDVFEGSCNSQWSNTTQ